jgi:hypothetical protein
MLQAILEGLKKEPKPATPPVDDAAPPAASADEAAPTLPQRPRRPSPRPSGRKPKSDAAPPKTPEPDNAPTADAADETEPVKAAEPAKAAKLVEAVAADPGIDERAPEAAVADAPAVEAASPAGDGPERKSGWWSTAARRVTGANRKAERTEPVSAPPERPTVKQPIDRGPEEPAAAGASAPTEDQPRVDAVTQAPTPPAAAPDGPDDAAPPAMDAAPDTAPTTDAPTDPAPTGDAPRDTAPTTGAATDSAPAEPASDGAPRGGMFRGLRTGLRWLRGGRDTASADEPPTAEDPPPAEPATVDAAAAQPTR